MEQTSMAAFPLLQLGPRTPGDLVEEAKAEAAEAKVARGMAAVAAVVLVVVVKAPG